MAAAASSLLDVETASRGLGGKTGSASSERDALGRVLVAISPDGSEALYTYDEGGGLQALELKHRGSSTAETIVGDITYNARGQREAIVYGPTSTPTMTTTYGYDPPTYRLAAFVGTPANSDELSTIRESDDESLQGHYHYDPVGNITDIRDTAQQTVYFNNSVVLAANSYVYDAVYRLIEATGREHASEGTGQRTHEQIVVGAQPMTSDPSAMRVYVQKYAYDSVGNILRMQHIPTGGSGSGWTRYYEYSAVGNRLVATSAPGEDEEDPYTHLYDYDEHGSMIEMPHLSSMIWNHDDELREVTAGTETVYFQYAGGIRSRKYTEKSGATTEERIYLGGWEVYRKRISGTLNLERESLHVSDGSGRICLVETKTVASGTAVGSPVGVWRYQLGNHLGSAAVEVDGDGEVISYEEYHPYGTSAYRAVDAGVDVSAKRYRYTGMEQDEETGLGYHSARYYAGWLGRWTAADPIGLGDGVNRFAYVKNCPTMDIDQTGTTAGPGDEKVIEYLTPHGGNQRPQIQVDGPVVQVIDFSEEELVEGDAPPSQPSQPLTAAEACARHHDSLCSTQEANRVWGTGELHFEGRQPNTAKATAQNLLVLGVGVGAGSAVAAAGSFVGAGALLIGLGSGAVGGGAGALSHEVIRQRDEDGAVTDPLALGDAVAEGAAVGAVMGVAFAGIGLGLRGIATRVTRPPTLPTESTTIAGAGPTRASRLYNDMEGELSRQNCVRCVTSFFDAQQNQGFVNPASHYQGRVEFHRPDQALAFITQHTDVQFAQTSTLRSFSGPGSYAVFNRFNPDVRQYGHILTARVQQNGTVHLYDPQWGRRVTPDEVGSFIAFRAIAGIP